MLHLFLELFTLGCFLAAGAHAGATRGRDGLAFFGALLWLGFVRENVVVLREVLYGFAPLTLELGRAPLIAAIIWGFSIYAAAVFAEETSGERLVGAGRRPGSGGEAGGVRPAGWRAYAAAAVFMVALVGFYEPFLERVAMARWEEGTRATAGVPWIALVGYPTLTLAFLAVWRAVAHRPRRALLLALLLPPLAAAHALGLQVVKDALGW